VDPEEHNEVFFCDDDDAAEEQNELVFCDDEIATNQSLNFFDLDHKSTITLADPPTSRPSSSTSYSLNHKQLDFLLFHQILESYIPGPASLKHPGYSVLASLLLFLRQQNPNPLLSLHRADRQVVLSTPVDEDEEDASAADGDEDDEESIVSTFCSLPSPTLSLSHLPI
jgi:hypothetical protein